MSRITFEATFGQVVNNQKYEIFCSEYVPRDEKNQIAEILKLWSCLGIDKYLGLPSMVGRTKKENF